MKNISVLLNIRKRRSFLVNILLYYIFLIYIISSLFVHYKLKVIQQKQTFNSVYTAKNRNAAAKIKNFLVVSSNQKSNEEAALSIAENPFYVENLPSSQFSSKFIFKDQPWAGSKNYTDYTVAHLGLKAIDNVKPLRPDYGMVVNDVIAFKYPINIPKCRKDSVANRTLFIAILSAPDYFEYRNVTRTTWLSLLKDPHYHRSLFDVIGYGFVVGRTSHSIVQKMIEEESKNYGDILQVEMDDSYRNLTRKSVSILNWVNSNCPHADFVMKVDDDVYVNVHNFASVLAELPPKNRSLYGRYALPEFLTRSRPEGMKQIISFCLHF